MSKRLRSMRTGHAAVLLFAFMLVPGVLLAATHTNGTVVHGKAGPGLDATQDALGLTAIIQNLKAIGEQQERDGGAAASATQELGDHATNLAYYEMSQHQSRDQWRDSEGCACKPRVRRRPAQPC